MTDVHTSRQLVLARLGAPAAQLPGEFYEHRTPAFLYIHARYAEYIDEALLEGRPEQALEHFMAFLEAEREHDYEAFHLGRELLLADMCVHVEYPSADPEPPPPGPPTRVVTRKLPRWSRRKPARARPRRVEPEQQRARVLERLGWPHPCLPGECTMLIGNDALTEIMAFFNDFDSKAITEADVGEALGRRTVLRERDRQAFCYGRAALLGLLVIRVRVPRPAAAAQAVRA